MKWLNAVNDCLGGNRYIIDLFDPRRLNRLVEPRFISLWGNLFQDRGLTVGLKISILNRFA